VLVIANYVVVVKLGFVWLISDVYNLRVDILTAGDSGVGILRWAHRDNLKAETIGLTTVGQVKGLRLNPKGTPLIVGNVASNWEPVRNKESKYYISESQVTMLTLLSIRPEKNCEY
jgi:hypothetical protein